MTDTINLGMPFIEGSQAQKHITHNEALRILDAVIQIGVLDTALTAPPSTPAEGARYVVASGATGAWAGHAKAIATYEDATWRYLVPKLGWCVWSAADEVIFVFDGTSWRDLRDLPVSLDSVGHLGINATATSPNLLSVKSNAALFSAINVVSGGTGDARIQVSKESSAKTASVVFSDAFSGRAEFGLVGSNAFKLKVSNDGATFVEALSIDQTSGNLTLPRGVLMCGVIAPSQITSNQNDYAPSGFSTAAVLRLSTDASRNITGLAGGAEGRRIYVVNAGANPAVLKDENASSTAANRFGFGSDMTLAAKQGATLIYDANASRWRQVGGPSASSGSAGATDAERQNSLLALIYQSKSIAEYRRLVNLFASGFKGASDTLNGILAGSSSNYAVTPANGMVAPTTAAGTQISQATGTAIGDATAGGGLAAAFDSNTNQAYSAVASGTVANGRSYVGKNYSGSPKQIASMTAYPANGTSTSYWDLATGGSAGLTHTLTLYGKNGSAPSAYNDGTVLGSVGPFADNSTASKSITSSDSSTAWDYVWVVNTSTASTDKPQFAEVQFFAPGSTYNMTLVTAMQSADASVSNARVVVEFDNAASPVLNTDLTVEVTCDGGSHWTAATLSAVTSYAGTSTQRKVAETADTVCTSGTSFGARIKTLNAKMVTVYGVTLTVR